MTYYGAKAAPIERSKVQAVSNYASREQANRDAFPGVWGNPATWGNEMVTMCPDESLCCGKENTACCAAHRGVWIKDGEISNVNPLTNSSSTASVVVSSTASSTAASTNSTASSTSFISSSTMSTPSPSSSSAQSGSASSSSNIGAMIGGAAGGGVVGIALGAGIVWLILRRRKLSRLQQSASPHNLASSMENEMPQSHEIDGRQRYQEVDGRELVEVGDNAVNRSIAMPYRP